jgi:hypothetical protein
MKFKVLDTEQGKFDQIGKLHGITTFVESGDSLFILKFDDGSFAAFDSYRVEVIKD